MLLSVVRGEDSVRIIGQFGNNCIKVRCKYIILKDHRGVMSLELGKALCICDNVLGGIISNSGLYGC